MNGTVLLDGSFHARLPAFGLANLKDHDKSPISIFPAGTLDSLALEYLQYGKAIEKLVVFSFGMDLLMVACGRRPIELEPGGLHMVKLVN
jgi:hypothetical protein